MKTKENYSRPASYEEACAMNGTQPINEAALRQLGMTDQQIAEWKLSEISKALNKGKPIDIFNGDRRWYPYFWSNGSPASFAFDCSNYDGSGASAGSGSRLTFHEKADSDYSGTHFLSLWLQYLS